MSKFKFKENKRLDPDEPWNGQRADWAEAGVSAFISATGETDSETNRTDPDTLADLISDLLHMCDREGLDALMILRRAESNWRIER